MTKTDKLVAGLTKLGYGEVRTASRRYRVFRRDTDGNDQMYVGRHGALRYGPTITNARSLTGTARYRSILEAI